jgi:hypothetical protein
MVGTPCRHTLASFLAFDLALDGEGVESGQELVLVHTLGGEEVSHVLRLGQALALFLDGIEYRAWTLCSTPMASRVRNIGRGHPTPPNMAGTLEVDVGRQFFDPRIDGRFKSVAMRAAVPEQLHHFDLARYGYGNRVANST